MLLFRSCIKLTACCVCVMCFRVLSWFELLFLVCNLFFKMLKFVKRQNGKKHFALPSYECCTCGLFCSVVVDIDVDVFIVVIVVDVVLFLLHSLSLSHTHSFSFILYLSFTESYCLSFAHIFFSLTISKCSFSFFSLLSTDVVHQQR